MNDRQIHEHISDLVDEEHQLRAHLQPTDADRARLSELEVQLDQAWDLLRRRQALREAGSDPDAAHEQAAVQVESYLQ